MVLGLLSQGLCCLLDDVFLVWVVVHKAPRARSQEIDRLGVPSKIYRSGGNPVLKSNVPRPRFRVDRYRLRFRPVSGEVMADGNPLIQVFQFVGSGFSPTLIDRKYDLGISPFCLRLESMRICSGQNGPKFTGLVDDQDGVLW
jgi:hypothetical protein